jgi:hypothetical protein
MRFQLKLNIGTEAVGDAPLDGSLPVLFFWLVCDGTLVATRDFPVTEMEARRLQTFLKDFRCELCVH